MSLPTHSYSVGISHRNAISSQPGHLEKPPDGRPYRVWRSCFPLAVHLRHSSCFLQLLNSSFLNFPGMAFQLLHYWSTNLESLSPASQSDFLFPTWTVLWPGRDLLSWELSLELTGFSQLVMQILHTSLTWSVETRIEEGCGQGRLSTEKLNLQLQQGTRMPCQMLAGQEIGLLACSYNCDTNVS